MSRRDGKSAKRESKVKKADGPVSLKGLAAHLGLSPTTLSLVLNDSPLANTIPQETKDRILVAAREFNYRPNFIARSLRSARTYTRDYQEVVAAWNEAGVPVWGSVPERVAIASGPEGWLSPDGLDAYRAVWRRALRATR